MELLKQRILEEGFCLPGNILKVDSFLNHQIDPELTLAMGKEFARRFEGTEIDKVVTVEASGIAIGLAVAAELGTKLVFARKNKSALMQEDRYTCPITSWWDHFCHTSKWNKCHSFKERSNSRILCYTINRGVH